ncbi:unnamed protein product [Mytilus coruscus]|uniref:ZP domain-containing protein n=1 Tax=Mytilus coruscus TaxID=42192 RepID=A0A6J8A5Z3_MYTCO|nr:unnamed protein product [Mytilus coruscus]
MVRHLGFHDHHSTGCDKNGKIESINGLPENELISIDNPYCHIDNNTCKWKNTLSRIHLMHVAHETNLDIAGGKNPKFYVLECKFGDFFGEAKVIFNEITQSSIPYNSEINTIIPPKSQISLKIKQNEQELSEVTIGDMLSLTFTGPGGYRIDPINCTAHPETPQNQKQLLLWSNDDCKSKDTAILEEQWTRKKNINNTIEITMYAFRFVQSKKVAIECFAHFCPQNDLTCTTKCQNSIVSNRKRRNVHQKYNTNHRYVESVSTTFTVVENLGANGSSGLPTNCILLAITLTFYLTLSGEE